MDSILGVKFRPLGESPNAKTILDISYICGADAAAFDRHPPHMPQRGKEGRATIPSSLLRLDLEENKGRNAAS